MIEFKNVAKRYPGGLDALKFVNLLIPAVSINFLTGHSGAGKSTFLKLITLAARPTRGEVWVDGECLNHIPTRRIPAHRRKIGTVFQDHNLLTDRNVFENIALPLRVRGVAERAIASRVRAALDKVGLLDKQHALPLALSGGQQQRVGIARAVVTRPHILLADEPTGNLDQDLSDEIMKLFYEFYHHGTTVLIATHDRRYLQNPDAGLITLEAGEIREYQPAEPMNAAPSHPGPDEVGRA